MNRAGSAPASARRAAGVAHRTPATSAGSRVRTGGESTRRLGFDGVFIYLFICRGRRACGRLGRAGLAGQWAARSHSVEKSVAGGGKEREKEEEKRPSPEGLDQLSVEHTVALKDAPPRRPQGAHQGGASLHSNPQLLRQAAYGGGGVRLSSRDVFGGRHVPPPGAHSFAAE